jgi:hypothetical protein
MNKLIEYEVELKNTKNNYAELLSKVRTIWEAMCYIYVHKNIEWQLWF